MKRPFPHPGQFALFDETAPLRQVSNMHDLPEDAHALIEVIGLQATIDLVKAWGGDEIAIPSVAHGHSMAWARLEEAIGQTAARTLVESRFKGTRVYVPLCRAALLAARDREIVDRLNGGESFRDVRRSIRLSRSYMYRLLRKHGY